MPNDALTIADHPLVQHKLSRMRDKTCPSPEFRQLLRDITLYLTYQATRDLALTLRAIDTPVAPMQAPVLAGQMPAVVSILRAGNGMLEGVLQVLPEAHVGFVGLYRDEQTLRPVQYYCKLPPDLASRPVLLVDPMLATGNSAVAAVDLLKDAGAESVVMLSLLAAPEGVDCLRAAHPDLRILTAALDDRLTDKAYIFPGLGDAGDRIFGT